MSVKIKFALFSAFLFSSVALIPNALAHGDHGQCKADFDKFCSGVSHDEGFKCLQDHQKELSTDCQVKFTKMKERREAVQKDCGDDLKKYCPTTDHGHAMWDCLQTNQSKLSTACQARVNEKPNFRKNADKAAAPATTSTTTPASTTPATTTPATTTPATPSK